MKEHLHYIFFANNFFNCTPFVLLCFVILFNVGHNTKVAHIYLHI